jgi:hypothetical protein
MSSGTMAFDDAETLCLSFGELHLLPRILAQGVRSIRYRLELCGKVQNRSWHFT